MANNGDVNRPPLMRKPLPPQSKPEVVSETHSDSSHQQPPQTQPVHNDGRNPRLPKGKAKGKDAGGVDGAGREDGSKAKPKAGNANGSGSRTQPLPITKENAWTYDPSLDGLGDDPMFWGQSEDPVIINECYATETKQCLNDSTVAYSADVLYPPFVVNLPEFVNEEDRAWFNERAYGQGNFQKLGFIEGEEKLCPKHLHACKYFEADSFPAKKRVVLWYYPFTRGQHVVLKDVTPRGAACPRWSEPDRKAFFRPAGDAAGNKQAKLAYYVTEEGASFQHFLDTNLPKIGHAWDLIDPSVHKDIKIIADTSPAWPLVPEFFEALGFTRDRFVGHSSSAERLVWPCTAPLRHPWHWQKIRRILGIPQANPKANKIIYFTRSVGSNRNYGRNIQNEKALLDAITSWLKIHNRPEQLVVYDHRTVSKLQEHRDLFKDAKMVIGPHGGAFYNLLFCPEHTISVEFFPDKRWDMNIALASFWIQSRMVDGRFYLLPRPSLGGAHDMVIDIEDVLHVFAREFPTL
eukprot:TRINITY_DN3290_c0_g1_i1.p1 TRINITY_DN3290_c0_g1~~TRINITY_DN3290_c0_g1_i1.p1  ORF type:complete len:578 (+),score=73.86 TRINITY_DN3290_c0_g1_i1:179-1735(+)